MLAGQGSADASQLAVRVPAGVAGPSTQATATAVGRAHAAIGATAVALAGRVYATGDKLTAAAAQYVRADETSAQRLAVLGGPVQP